LSVQLQITVFRDKVSFNMQLIHVLASSTSYYVHSRCTVEDIFKNVSSCILTLCLSVQYSAHAEADSYVV
jgi:hypothetical protein